MNTQKLTPTEQRWNDYGMDMMFYIAVPSFLYVWSMQKGYTEKIGKIVALSASSLVFSLNDGLGFANHKHPDVIIDIRDLSMMVTGSLLFLLSTYIDQKCEKKLI